MDTSFFKDFVDTTFRDGQQSPLLFDTYKYRFNFEDKKILMEGLIRLGIRHFEFFSPVVSEVEKNDFIKLKKYTASFTKTKLMYIAHCRLLEKDVEEALKIGFNGLNLYIGASSYAQKFSHNNSLDEIKMKAFILIKSLRKKHPSLYIRFSVEDTFRTSLKDVFAIYDMLSPYVNTFGMPDTVGEATPDVVQTTVKALKQRYPKTDLECHFHNDRGLSIINALTAVKAGVSYIDTSVWGLAERSGITSVTGLLLNLVHENPVFKKKFNIPLSYPINIIMASILKMQVPYTEPVSLTNRTHTAGVHQKAILRNTQVYEAHNLDKFGVTKNQILLGPLSGWNLIYYFLKEVQGFEITKEQAQEIASLFKAQTLRITRKFKPEALLRSIISRYKLSQEFIPKNLAMKRVENFN